MVFGRHVSFQVKMLHYDWTEEKAEFFFLEVIKLENIKTILDSKQRHTADLYKNCCTSIFFKVRFHCPRFKIQEERSKR